jgi:hypothetical protein
MYSANPFRRPLRRLSPFCEQGIPAPGPVFRPEDRDIASKQREPRPVAEKTMGIWKQAKPFVTDAFYVLWSRPPGLTLSRSVSADS